MFRARTTVIISMIAFLLTGTVAHASPQVEGGALGGIFGGIAGALLDHKNPWRGGVIGAGLGAIAGATISDISVRGAQEALQNGRPVEYRIENGSGIYRADPVGEAYYPDEHTTCRKVHERIWEYDRLVRDTTREVCEGERTDNGYWEPTAYAAPPAYTMPAPPDVVLIPGTYVYAVPDAPVNILYYRNCWWRPYRGNWYRANHWNGPWSYVRRGWVPRAVVAVPADYPRMIHGRDHHDHDDWGRDRGRHEGWRNRGWGRWSRRDDD